MYRSCDTEFNLSRHLIPFLQDSAFYAELSRHIKKMPTRDMPTAGVTYDLKADEIRLYWNPDFFEWMTAHNTPASPGDGDAYVRGVLTHELMHLVFGHVNARRRTPHKIWNIATDCSINSMITTNSKTNDNVGKKIPSFGAIPGQLPTKRPETWKPGSPCVAMSKDEEAQASLAALIASFPSGRASEWYFNKLHQFDQEEKSKGRPGVGDGSGDPEFGEMDEHDMWDDIPEDQREYVESKIKAAVEKAVKHADAQANGWGNIPQDVRDDIRRSVSTVINWRSLLRQFVGTLLRGNRTTSIKRINKRYPYIHPGTKRSYQAKLLLAMDQSGSVDNDMLADFFQELSTLARKLDVELLPFDCSADARDIFKWKRGTNPKLTRTKAGGTNFSAATEVFNDPKNRGRWDGLMILTDGEAPAPVSCRGKRGWILGKGQKLHFSTSELQIFLSKETPMTGAWR